MENGFPIKTVVSCVGLLFLGISGCSGIEVVNTGHRGVKTTYGAVQEGILEEGLYWYNPLTSSIHEMNVQVQTHQLDLQTYTRDVQQAKLHLVVNYNLEKTKAPEMYRDVGEDWEEKLLPQAISGTVKTVIGKWDAVDLVGNRDTAQALIQEQLTAALAQRDVHVTRVELTDITYTAEFEKAVESKVKAIQEAEQAKNQTVQVSEQAKQKVISAEAEAKSMTIRSQALSQNQALVSYEAVQKWDGKLPVYMLGGATPFISIPSQKD